MEHLTHVSGLTREMIEERLKAAGLEYRVRTEGFRDGFFRRNSIDFRDYFTPEERAEQKRRIEELRKSIEYPSIIRTPDYHFHALYRIEPGFDMSKLDGKIAFRQGFLVESTVIYGIARQEPRRENKT
jgi:hypothetical protein